MVWASRNQTLLPLLFIYFLFIFFSGTLTVFGGVAAFARVRSIPSLIAGIVFGSSLVASASFIRRGLDENYDGTKGFILAASESIYRKNTQVRLVDVVMDFFFFFRLIWIIGFEYGISVLKIKETNACLAFGGYWLTHQCILLVQAQTRINSHSFLNSNSSNSSSNNSSSNNSSNNNK
jgi:hypothetical protein